MSLDKCRIVELPKISDPRGNLTFVEGGGRHIPFDIKRIYYLYDVPEGADRGSHGHKALQQLIVAISGSFEVVLDDGVNKKSFHLDTPNQGLLVSPMMWRDIHGFSSGAACLVLASELYSEDDYYRNYDDYLRDVRGVK